MAFRAAAAALATFLGTLVGLLLPTPAAAGQACVGVVVDARLAGGALSTGCADGDPDSGLEALSAAGFRYAFVPRFPGLVCSIDGQPECSRTSSTTYWSYWYREPGRSAWVYSSLGAGNRDPAPGGMEAWVWQEGGRRRPPDVSLVSVCPQAQAQPRPTTVPPTTVPPTTSAPPSSTQATASAPRTPATRTTAVRRPRTPTSSPSPASSRSRDAPTIEGKYRSSASPDAAGYATRVTSPTSTPASDRPSGRPTAVTAGGTNAAAESSPPWAGFAVGTALVTALGGVTMWRASRRSRS